MGGLIGAAFASAVAAVGRATDITATSREIDALADVAYRDTRAGKGRGKRVGGWWTHTGHSIAQGNRWGGPHLHAREMARRALKPGDPRRKAFIDAHRS